MIQFNLFKISLLTFCFLTFGIGVSFAQDTTDDKWVNSNNDVVIHPSFNGNVGIGTSAPQYKLDIVGGLRTKGNQRIQNPNAHGYFTLEGTGNIHQRMTLFTQDDNISWNYTTNLLKMYNENGVASTLKLYQNASGTDKYSSLQLGGASGVATLRGFGSKDLLINEAGGNVGIGLASANYKLDVNGTINTNSVYAINGLSILSNPKHQSNIRLGRILVAEPITTGTENFIAGYRAGKSLSTGRANMIFGHAAGHNLVSGSFNVYIGENAGQNNSSASNNVFIGKDAGRNIQDGTNTFIGTNAGVNKTSGFSNTFLGYNSGFYNISGSSNVFVGYQAGMHLESGTNNILIGTGSGPQSTDTNKSWTDKLFIGSYKKPDQPLVYGDFSSGVVSIGTKELDANYTLNVGGVLNAEEILINGEPLSLISNENSGLIAYYPFNGNANDESGNNNNGNVEGADLTQDSYGQNNKAYSFDGIDDGISMPNLGPYATFTLITKIKFTSTSLLSIFSGINAAWYPSVMNGKIAWGNGTGWVTGTSLINDDQWHDIAYIFDNGAISMYVDGQIEFSGTATYTNGTIQRIGKLGSNARYFNGSLDEVRIYNKALGVQEINNTLNGSQNSGLWTSNGNDINYTQGKVGIGTNNPLADLSVAGTKMVVGGNNITGNYNVDQAVFELQSASGSFFKMNGGTSNMQFNSGENGNNLFAEGKDLSFYAYNTGVSPAERMRITMDGKVGIGTTTVPSDYMVAIDGKMILEGIKVQNSEQWWADYVFEDDYKLKELNEVESFIKENKHLPDVPSTKEVGENGVDLGKMDATLLRKIEELTLYVIELNKKVNKLEEENKNLKSAQK